MLSYHYLSEWLFYDETTGHLWWLKRPSNRVNMDIPAGTLRSTDGYIDVGIRGRQHRAHHIAWLLHYKTPHMHTIDHINRIRTDNRIVNLRDVPIQINTMNGSSHSDSEFRIKGVAYDPKYPSKPYRVQISRHGKVVHRSFHTTLEAATEQAHKFYSTE